MILLMQQIVHTHHFNLAVVTQSCRTETRKGEVSAFWTPYSPKRVLIDEFESRGRLTYYFR